MLGPTLRDRVAVPHEGGCESYVPEQRFLSDEESVAVAAEFRRRHPWRLRFFAAVLGWGDLGTETVLREFVRSRPFVSFRPAAAAGNFVGAVSPQARSRRHA